MVNRTNRRYWSVRYERLADSIGPVDDRAVNVTWMRLKRLRYGGRDDAGPYWVSKRGDVYRFDDLPAKGQRGDDDTEDDDSDMSYGAGSYGGDYTTAWGGGDTGASSYPNAPDNYRYNNNPSEDILSKWQVTSSKRTVTNPRDLQSTRPLPDDSWDDIPETAGRGKYSKASVREAAERMPCVEAARAEGREVRLQYNHSVNGHKKQTDQLLCPGSRREGRPVIVRFTGDLHSDGSQAAGRKAHLKASCEDEYRATTTSTRTDSAADCRPCCDDCDEDKEEKQAAKERLKEKYREQQTTRNRVVDKRSVTDKSQVTRGKINNNPYYDPSSRNSLARNAGVRYFMPPDFYDPQAETQIPQTNDWPTDIASDVEFIELPNGEIQTLLPVVDGKRMPKRVFDFANGKGKKYILEPLLDKGVSKMGAIITMGQAASESGFGTGNSGKKQDGTVDQYYNLFSTLGGSKKNLGTKDGNLQRFKSYTEALEYYLSNNDKKYPLYRELINKEQITIDDFNKAFRQFNHYPSLGSSDPVYNANPLANYGQEVFDAAEKVLVAIISQKLTEFKKQQVDRLIQQKKWIVHI